MAVEPFLGDKVWAFRMSGDMPQIVNGICVGICIDAAGIRTKPKECLSKFYTVVYDTEDKLDSVDFDFVCVEYTLDELLLFGVKPFFVELYKKIEEEARKLETQTLNEKTQ